MINLPFDKIDKASIDVLIAEERAERKTLEYKRDLPGRKDEDAKEFLADVSSFANASGGDMIFGVEERIDVAGKRTGKPGKVAGLKAVSADEEIRRLENMIRDGIEPRLKVQTRAVEGFEAGLVFVLRIPQSFLAPHMVTYRGTSRFYIRDSAGKHQLDVGEIRAAFFASESLPERIRRFRAERLAKIMSGETPVPLDTEPKVVLHVVPFAALSGARASGIRMPTRDTTTFLPIQRCSGGFGCRWNLDGLCYFETQGQDRTCWH